MYTSSADGKPHFVDVSGMEYPAGEARHIYTSAGAPGGAILGDCWVDSADGYTLYCKESAGILRQRKDFSVPGAISIPASPGVFRAHADTASGTKYLGGADRAAAASAQVVLFTAHSAQSLRYLVCTAGTAPGGMAFDVLTVQRSTDQGATWTDTSSTCTFTGSGKTCSSAAVTALNQFDELAVKIVRDALSISAAYNCTAVVN